VAVIYLHSAPYLEVSPRRRANETPGTRYYPNGSDPCDRFPARVHAASSKVSAGSWESTHERLSGGTDGLPERAS
jgi:hypothetical protein